jgi:hypothetical protein
MLGELACRFYRRLLADPGRHPTESALALARRDLLQDPQVESQFWAVDPVTPLMFGQEGRLLEPVAQRSPQMDRLRPQPQPLLLGAAGNWLLLPTSWGGEWS